MRCAIPITLVAALALPVSGRAGEARPSVKQLQAMAAAASEKRAARRESLARLFQGQDARRALHAAGIDSGQVLLAVSALDQEDVDRLAARADRAQRDFAAGALTNLQLTYIVIALATAVIILVIVAA
jgi:hypothetical protein